MSSSSSFSFCKRPSVPAHSGSHRRFSAGVVSVSYILQLELLLVFQFPLVESTELVDLVLVLASDLGLVTNGLLVLFGKLWQEQRVSWRRQESGRGRRGDLPYVSAC